MNRIDYNARKEVYEKAIEKYGVDNQLLVAIEEMSELQKEICKRFRGRDNIKAIAEEIADVTIMLEQLRIMFDINDSVCQEMDYKIERLNQRLSVTKEDNA